MTYEDFKTAVAAGDEATIDRAMDPPQRCVIEALMVTNTAIATRLAVQVAAIDGVTAEIAELRTRIDALEVALLEKIHG